MTEPKSSTDDFEKAERERRFREDLIDAYDEELEMEVDDRILDGENCLLPEARDLRARPTSASCSNCRVNSSSCRTGWCIRATGLS
jgi:hypothetical protein